MSTPIVLKTLAEATAWIEAERRAGRSVGLAPTMGAIHAGHQSLVAASRARGHATAATIFVNPAQFGPQEDFQRYPRTLDDDLKLLGDAGAAAVFAPEIGVVYPPRFATYVEPGGAAEPLEGRCRPGHFRGVATVVLKLFQMLPADEAFFGQKDFQQALVIQQMVRDFNLTIRIVVCPIVREADGLAMSSRNRYLSPAERQRALSLSQSLELADSLLRGGERDGCVLVARMQERLAADDVAVDYATIADRETLEPLPCVDRPAVALVAGRVGSTRLIDNRLLG